MSKLLANDFYEKLQEITTSKLLEKSKFHPNGLFSEQIFGPIKNFTCQHKFHGIIHEGETCTECGVDIVSASERRKRFAKIILPFEVVNPIMYSIVVSVCGTKIKTMIDTLMTNECSTLYKTHDNKFYIETEVREEKSTDESFEKLDAIRELVTSICNIEVEKENKKWIYIKENLDKLLIKEIIVLPPDLRPVTKLNDNKQFVADKINRYYTKLIIKKESIEKSTIDLKNSEKKIFYHFYKPVQETVNQLYEHILCVLSKKEGLIRGSILGKRIDFSGRAVIVPDPTLNLDECVLPYIMFLELFKIQIGKKLIELNFFKLLNNSIDFLDECLRNKNPALFELCSSMKDEVCLLNRQPSLHRLNMLGFKIKVSLDNVIKIHPMVCPCFNADFDGDQMAVYIPITPESKQEVIDKFLVTKNLRNPANGELTTTPNQDIILGLYLLTSDKFPGLREIENCKGTFVPAYVKIFNDCLPIDYPIINKTIDKKELLNILNDINQKYDPQITKEVLDSIKSIGFKYSTLFGSTMSLDQFMLIDKNLKNEIFEGDLQESLSKIQSQETTNRLRKSFGYSYIIDSGSRGTWDQARQIILCRGFVSNFRGQILHTPVKSGLLDGLTEQEFFISTYGSRKGLLDTALNTGVSGYLSRKLIFACVNLQKSSKDDCGTHDFLVVAVNSKKKAEMLCYRYYLNENDELTYITPENCYNLVGKTIRLRSPIYCKTYEICNKCYGDFHKILDSKFIGVIAAQILGERGTQLVLRTFHTSLSKNTKILDINNNSYTIKEVYDKIKNSELFYTFSCSPSGKIEVCRVTDAHKDRFEKKMVRVTLDNNQIVECTLDHKFIMRDGSEREACDLQINDSLMPIYFGEEKYGYRTIRQNIRSKNNRYKHDLIYRLSSDHKDCKTSKNLNENYKACIHHIDKNKKNDYPTNLLITDESKHIGTFHTEDSINIDRSNCKLAVSRSNKRRTRDPEFVKKFNIKRNNTLKKNNSTISMKQKILKLFRDNPNRGFEVTTKSRISCIKIIIDKIKSYNLELSNHSYDLVRLEFYKSGKRYPTFNYAVRTYPELFDKFTIVDQERKDKNQLQSEFRSNTVKNKMIELNLEFNEENFDIANSKVYPNPKTRWSRKSIDRFSPGILDFLKDNHRITKFEVVELENYEEFYDLTVDSKYENFALSSGIFIHNSGVANSKSGNTDMKQDDIVADLSTVSDLLHKFVCKDPAQIVSNLYEIYNKSGNIFHVHFESIVSQLMWCDATKWRLIENRSSIEPDYYSVQKVPSYESWLLGLGFSNPKFHIIKGLLNSTSNNYFGILDRMLLGKKVEED